MTSFLFLRAELLVSTRCLFLNKFYIAEGVTIQKLFTLIDNILFHSSSARSKLGQKTTLFLEQPNIRCDL
uniref:Ovule protein n=1 Tax=Caenorhabditis tropicalis TaxID=1561998 RepID=A0A1I7UXI3_9PELO